MPKIPSAAAWLFATARARLNLIEGNWEAIFKTNDIRSLSYGIRPLAHR
jgi:hypothetical protein